MAEAVASRLQELEAECASLCREHGWVNAAGDPNYQLVRSAAAALRERAGLMLLAIHPRGGGAGQQGRPVTHSQAGQGAEALLEGMWPEGEPGSDQLRELSLRVAGMLGDAGEVLREAVFGNAIPFRTESISRLPDGLRKQGLSIGGRLVAIFRPRVLVLLGGDRVLFRMAVSELPGRVADSAEEAFGTTQRTYRDVVVADGNGSTFAAVVPLHATEEGLRALRRRLEAHGLAPGQG